MNMAVTSKALTSPDLHSPGIDMTGRVDVLAARLLRMAVVRAHDPAIEALYQTFQPAVDTLLHLRLRKVNCAQLFKQIGIAPHDQMKKAKVTRKRKSKVVMP
jgi:hypothetical protein